MTILSSFVAKTSDVLAFVEIGRRDGWRSLGNGQGREVSVLSAKLRGREIPRGTRWACIILSLTMLRLMKTNHSGLAIRYPLIASTLAACIFLLILSLVIGTCVLPATFSTATGEVNSQHQAKNASKSVSDPPPSLASRSRSHSTPLRKRRFNITRRLSGNLRTVSFIYLERFQLKCLIWILWRICQRPRRALTRSQSRWRLPLGLRQTIYLKSLYVQRALLQRRWETSSGDGLCISVINLVKTNIDPVLRTDKFPSTVKSLLCLTVPFRAPYKPLFPWV